jgi:hypothetical protein
MARVAERGVGDDPVGEIVDAFAERYRAEPAYRALWLGRQLTDELHAADRHNKRVLAAGVRRLLAANGARDGAALQTACEAGVLTADALLQEAFRRDPAGDPALLAESKVILRGYLEDVMAR